VADDDQDEASKTEDPTPKRMRDAREKGDVPISREINNWFTLLGFAIFVAFFLGIMANDLFETGRFFFQNAHVLFFDAPDASVHFWQTSWQFMLIVAIPFGMAILFAIAGGVLQNGLIFTTEPMKPKLSKINPVQGFKRLFSMRSLIEFAKSVFKLVLITGAIAIVIIPAMDRVPRMVDEPSIVMAQELLEDALIVIIVVLALLTVIAFLDLMYQRYEHNKKLRMTKQQVRDEYKQTEGDPQIKARLRQIRQQRARARMMQNVPEADVVVTNPTHFAVALKYDQGSMQAPKVTAKGADLVAKKIREVAEENDVPIVENKPLARALYDTVDLDDEVPQEHYQAVAEVISYVMRLKEGVKAAYKN